MPDTWIHNRRMEKKRKWKEGAHGLRLVSGSIRARLIKIPVSRGGGSSDFFAVSENFSISRHQVSLPAADFLRRTM